MELTFKEAYDKIVGAYMRNELNPFSSCACFIGNLLGHGNWACIRQFGHHGQSRLRIEIPELTGGYHPADIVRMENNFLKVLNYRVHGNRGVCTEERVFLAMESTLLMLKEIHERAGEVVEEFTFKQREPC